MKMMKLVISNETGKAIVLIFSVLCVSSSCSCSRIIEREFQPQRVITNKGEIRVPLEIRNNVPYIAVYINNNGPYRFLVDTGSGIVSVSPKVAEENDLKHVWWLTGKGQLADGSYDSHDIVSISRLQIGEVVFEDFLAGVCVRKEDADADGILGFSLFQRGLLTLDYSGKTLIIEPYKTLVGQPVSKSDGKTGDSSLIVLPCGAMAFPYYPEGGTPAIDVFLVAKDKPVNKCRAVVDTGFSGMFMLPAQTESLFPGKEFRGEFQGTLGNNAMLSSRCFEIEANIFIGGVGIVEPVVGFREGSDGLIGGEFFDLVQILTFDFDNQLYCMGKIGSEAGAMQNNQEKNGVGSP